jgi:hypothetical protein
LYITYPGGGGGHWIGYLVYLLQDNPVEHLQDAINFHNYSHSKSIVSSHWRQNDNNDWKVFSASPAYNFNLYLQAYTKNEIFKKTWGESTFVEWFNDALVSAAYQLGNEWYQDYQQTIDLHYDLILSDPDNFCKELFALLDQSQIVYNPNREIVFDAIESFKKTLPDPLDYFDNLDDFLWLSWCFGIMHHEGMSGNIDYHNCDKADLVNSILPRRQYFADYTRPYVTFFTCS